MKHHIERNTVQETLVIPLLARKVCSKRYPALFSDPEAERICSMLAFDSCNRRGAKMMTKTWLREAGIRDVDALFSPEDPASICHVKELYARLPRHFRRAGLHPQTDAQIPRQRGEHADRQNQLSGGFVLRADYKNRVAKGMMTGFAAGTLAAE